MTITREEIIQKLAGIIADQLTKPHEELEVLVAERPDIPLELLGIDELEHYELMMNVEEAFECEISDEDAESLLTFGELVEYVEDCSEATTQA